MKNIFLNTDVVVDFLIDRKPFSDFSSRIFSFGERNKIRIYISSLTFSNTYIILRQFAGHKRIIENLEKLEAISRIVKVNSKCVNLALQSSFRDFEDALQYYSAIQQRNIDLIVTENLKAYRYSKLPVMSAETCLKLIEKQYEI